MSITLCYPFSTTFCNNPACSCRQERELAMTKREVKTMSITDIANALNTLNEKQRTHDKAKEKYLDSSTELDWEDWGNYEIEQLLEAERDLSAVLDQYIWEKVDERVRAILKERP